MIEQIVYTKIEPQMESMKVKGIWNGFTRAKSSTSSILIEEYKFEDA